MIITDCTNLVLFNELSNATPNGVWTVDNTLWPVPANYNDPVNVCGLNSTSNGVDYTYTVTCGTSTSSATITVFLKNSGDELMPGDNCSNAIGIPVMDITTNPTFVGAYSFRGTCPYANATFDTNTTLLHYYPHVNINTSEDLWFKVLVNPGYAELTIKADGNPYIPTGITNDWINLYDVTDKNNPCTDPYTVNYDLAQTNYTDTINSDNEVEICFHAAGQNLTNYNLTIQRCYLIRVGTFGYAGQFDLTITLT